MAAMTVLETVVERRVGSTPTKSTTVRPTGRHSSHKRVVVGSNPIAVTGVTGGRIKVDYFMSTDLVTLPSIGVQVRCLTAQTRPELTEGQIYVVAHDPDLARFPYPINYARYQPDDFRFIAIEIPGKKEYGIYPVGIFEVIT